MFTGTRSDLPTRKLLNGKSVSITTLGLGGGLLGNAVIPISDETAEQTLKQAWISGVRYFDGAPLYGVGLCLKRMGHFLKQYPREQFAISSKLGFVIKDGATRTDVDNCFQDGQDKHVEFDYSYNGIMLSIQQNLDLLQTDYLDIAFVHDLGRRVHRDNHTSMMDMFFNHGGLQAMQELRTNGIVRAIGLGVNEWEVCVEAIERGFIPDCIMLAGRYTLLDQSALGTFFDLCSTHHISVISAGVYNSGILSGDSANVSFNYAPASDDIVARKKSISHICEQHQVMLPQVALHFPLLHPNVISVVTGARSALEIKQSAERMLKETSVEVWVDLKKQGLIDDRAPTISNKANCRP